MKQIHLSEFAFMINTSSVSSQQASPKLVSPEAASVWIQDGTWFQEENSAELTEWENDIRKYPAEPLPSDLYHYAFVMDSARDVANILNTFIAGGDKEDLYVDEMSDMPHDSIES